MLPAHTRGQSSTTRPIARANARWRVSPRAGNVVSRAFLAVLLVGMLSAPFLPTMPVVLPEHEASAAPNLVSPTGTKMIGTGRYNVYATREGLVGHMTSSGWFIQPHDYFVSLPSCTTTNCPGGNYFGGNKTECGDKCYVRVINPSTKACRVEPIKDTGPWFTVDDWWSSTAGRYLNTLASNPNKPIPQGMTGADLARAGYDVGYGKSGSYGSSNRYKVVGNPASIDIADGTWYDLKLNAADRVGSMVEVNMIWQTGESPAAAAKACGHPLNQAAGSSGTTTARVSLSDSSGKVGETRTVSGSGFRSGETVRVYLDSADTTPLATVTATSTGTFSTSFRVPQAKYGNHGVIAVGASSGNLGQTIFKVNPDLNKTPGSGPVGTTITVSVTGFGAKESVRINWKTETGTSLATGTTNAAGSATIAFQIPAGSSGWTDFVATGATSGAQAYGAVNVTGGTPVPEPSPIAGSNPSFSGSSLPIVKGSSSVASTSPTRAFDGSTNSNWYTTGPAPSNAALTLDLGDVKQLSGVKWTYGTADGVDNMRLELSANGTSWTHLSTTTARAPGTWEGSKTTAQARYVRLVFDNLSGHPYLGIVAEVQAWGTNVTTPGPGSNPSFSGSKLAIVNGSSSATSTSPTRAFDGSLSSNWYTTGSTPGGAALTLDLGLVQQLSGVKWTYGTADGVDQMQLQVSADGSTWTPLGTTSARQPLTWEGTTTTAQARYVRLVFDNTSNRPYLGIVAEVQVWGNASSAPPPMPGSNPSFSGSALPITASTSSASSTSPTRAHDGSLNSNWYTTGAAPSSAALTLDLGRVQQLSGIKWTYGTADGVDQMRLQISADGTNWSQLVTTSARQPLTWEGWSTTAQARYVRLIFDNTTDRPHLGIVAEVQVWGSTASSQTTSLQRTAALDQAAATPASSPVALPATPNPATTPVATHEAASPEPAQTEPVEPTVEPEITPEATTPEPTQSPWPTVEPTVEATLEPGTPEPTPTEAAVETETSEAPVEPQPGYISGTGGEGAVCRTGADAGTDVIAVLPENTALLLTGPVENDWQPVSCEGVPGFIFAGFVTPGTPPEPTETAQSEDVPGAALTEEAPELAETPTAEPTVPVTPEPVLITREIVVSAESDTSVTSLEPELPQPGDEAGTLAMGGEDAAVTSLTFEVQGIAPGTVVDAQLVLTGSGAAAAPGGELRVLPGAWIDEYSATWNEIQNAGASNAGWIDWIEPGVESGVDVTGVVNGDGTITFILVGTPDQIATIASREAGAPAYLVITVEEWTTPVE